MRSATTPAELAVRGAVERYRVERSDTIAAGLVRLAHPVPGWGTDTPVLAAQWAGQSPTLREGGARTPYHAPHTPPWQAGEYPTLGMFGNQDDVADERPTSQPGATTQAARQFVAPDGYWRQNLWHQMGHEAKQLGGHNFWKGFKTSFWDLENALVLTATMGASITIRETGVDGTIRNRVRGHRQFGDLDETVQILGHPGTHFAATGVLWLTSTLTKDVEQHELAQALTEALAVNGVTTLALKAAANTRAPDDVPYAWPSGHTSSAFTVAAVLNEYYGPWVGIPSLALAGLVGYQRVDSRVHDFSDVVFGGMLGYIIGTSIARDEKAEFPELFGMQVVPFYDPETNASGLALMKRW